MRLGEKAFLASSLLCVITSVIMHCMGCSVLSIVIVLNLPHTILITLLIGLIIIVGIGHAIMKAYIYVNRPKTLSKRIGGTVLSVSERDRQQRSAGVTDRSGKNPSFSDDNEEGS